MKCCCGTDDRRVFTSSFVVLPSNDRMGDGGDMFKRSVLNILSRANEKKLVKINKASGTFDSTSRRLSLRRESTFASQTNGILRGVTFLFESLIPFPYLAIFFHTVVADSQRFNIQHPHEPLGHEAVEH